MIAGSHNVSQTQKHDLICPVKASRPSAAAGLARLGWDCAGLRCAGLAGDGCSCQTATSEASNGLSDEDKQNQPDVFGRGIENMLILSEFNIYVLMKVNNM